MAVFHVTIEVLGDCDDDIISIFHVINSRLSSCDRRATIIGVNQVSESGVIRHAPQ
jgi:hypothetical protein